MTECKNCKAELVWKQPYHKGDLPVNPDGRMHSCKGTEYKNLEIWKQKWDTVTKYNVPIYCNMCQRTYKYTSVCKHMITDGFIEGTDTVEFYSDRYTAVKRRVLIRNKRKAAEAPKKPKVSRKRPKPI